MGGGGGGGVCARADVYLGACARTRYVRAHERTPSVHSRTESELFRARACARGTNTKSALVLARPDARARPRAHTHATQEQRRREAEEAEARRARQLAEEVWRSMEVLVARLYAPTVDTFIDSC